MRVFLVQTAHGLAPSSGGFKANISLLRNLQGLAKGIDPNIVHHDPLVTTFTDQDGIHNIVISRNIFRDNYSYAQYLEDTRAYLEGDEFHPIMHDAVRIYSTHISDFRPTHVIFNDALTMKITAVHPLRSTFKRISVIHSAEQLPFGPYCAGVSGHCLSARIENNLLRNVDGIWAVSRAIQDYAWEHGRLKTKFMIHSRNTFLSDKTRGLPKVRNNVERDEVGMINPCPYKGLSILLALAKKLPHIKFVTWESWGSEPEDMEILRALPNVQVLPTTLNTNEIWDRIRILLAPSIWYEAWGIVVTEAQLRGIPVIASNAGGLPEAKVGVPYCIPVKIVSGERQEALVKLMTDREAYLALVSLTAAKTRAWLEGLDCRAHEKWLLSMVDENE
ncbi:glycosyltransferase [Podospora fimiseda]|uniref:Glycosyltransferase n=1 Tax=Podospora fimiseda TaxID=252190 RepID=A0AAN6YNZ9_9PEZI|nr:glycosyltransferase [Podospora fimiseda]